MYTCIIIDDEVMARKSLQRLCEKINNLTVIATCDSAEDALNVMEEQVPDILLLDVEMPGLSGLQLIEKLAVMPQIVLTTSKTDYAFEAFQYQVADYVKKPVTLPRLEQALLKIFAYIDANKGQTETAVGNNNDIYVKTDGKYVRLDFNNIQYIENIGDYVRIKTNKEAIIVHCTVKAVEEKLPAHMFMKVHRSYIINLSKIVDIEENTLVVGDKVIPISRANRPALLNKLNML